jgi:hypothetical protein
MKVEVYHDTVCVATVETNHTEILDALELAWEYTQNIDNSWSLEPKRVVTVMPQTTRALRSSMVGDIFIVDDRKFIVAPIGFKELIDVG